MLEYASHANKATVQLEGPKIEWRMDVSLEAIGTSSRGKNDNGPAIAAKWFRLRIVQCTSLLAAVQPDLSHLGAP